jgi:hypothetical protein
MFKIITLYGQHLRSNDYLINNKGCICKREHIGTPYDFSGSWKLLGIEHVKRNHFISFEVLKTWTVEQFETFEWRYKNGNPQWTVRDLDHGTTRTWGNTKYHGIKYMRKEK